MRVKINFEADSFPFVGAACGFEIGIVLRELAEKIEGRTKSQLRGFTSVLHDSEGNSVGMVAIEE